MNVIEFATLNSRIQYYETIENYLTDGRIYFRQNYIIMMLLDTIKVQKMIVYLLGGLVFIFYGSAIPRKWAKFQTSNAKQEQKLDEEEAMPMNEKL